jgi:hypothetical protein
MNLRKKYLIRAPLQFKMMPPPKIIDLTSDFFEEKKIKESRRFVNQNPKMND